MVTSVLGVEMMFDECEVIGSRPRVVVRWNGDDRKDGGV